MIIQLSPTVFNKKYLPALTDTKRTQIYYGGSGSGKSYFLAQRCIIQSFKKSNNILVARKYGNTNRKSTFIQLKNTIYTWNLSSYFTINNLSITNIVTNSQIIFTGLDDVQKIKSISGIKIIWIQQASQVTKDDFIQLNLRLRGRSIDPNIKHMIWLSFNPISKLHWIRQQFFKQDGEPRIGCTNNRDSISQTVSFYHSTYKDNAWVDDQYIQYLNSFKKTSPYHYDVYTLGKWGTFGQLVLPNFRIQQFDIPAIISTSNYSATGLDFGYNDPSTAVLVTQNDQTLYICQQLYGRKWTNTDLAYQIANNTTYIKESTIYADSAEPQRIQQLRKSGYDITPVVKKTIKQSLNNLKTMPIIIHPNCVKTIQQISGYQYQKDKKSGEYTDNPIQINNHCMDALRYATMKYFMQRNISGGRVVAA